MVKIKTWTVTKDKIVIASDYIEDIEWALLSLFYDLDKTGILLAWALASKIPVLSNECNNFYYKQTHIFSYIT